MGLQALLSVSEEGGEHECLGVIPGRCAACLGGPKVPHMGWNRVHQRRPHPVFDGIPDGTYFYFVHSYYPDPEDEVVLGETDYGVTFACAVALDNLVATQFHPEKSGELGSGSTTTSCELRTGLASRASSRVGANVRRACCEIGRMPRSEGDAGRRA